MMRRVIPLLIGVVLGLAACVDSHVERIVVIDPGHGGIDPGAIGGSAGTLEKEVALQAGLALRDRLEATGRYRVIMTRDDDRMVGLLERLQIAGQSHGELLISLHADSLVTAPQVNGASVYTLSEPGSDVDAMAWAREGIATEILAGIDPSSRDDLAPEMLIDLTNTSSVRFAELLLQELNGATKMLRRRPAQASFVVLQSPAIPSVLVELGYLSNPVDEQFLADDAHIARLAAAMARAIDMYFGVQRS